MSNFGKALENMHVQTVSESWRSGWRLWLDIVFSLSANMVNSPGLGICYQEYPVRLTRDDILSVLQEEILLRGCDISAFFQDVTLCAW